MGKLLDKVQSSNVIKDNEMYDYFHFGMIMRHADVVWRGKTDKNHTYYKFKYEYDETGKEVYFTIWADDLIVKNNKLYVWANDSAIISIYDINEKKEEKVNKKEFFTEVCGDFYFLYNKVDDDDDLSCSCAKDE